MLHVFFCFGHSSTPAAHTACRYFMGSRGLKSGDSSHDSPHVCLDSLQRVEQVCDGELLISDCD